MSCTYFFVIYPKTVLVISFTGSAFSEVFRPANEKFKIEVCSGSIELGLERNTFSHCPPPFPVQWFSSVFPCHKIRTNSLSDQISHRWMAGKKDAAPPPFHPSVQVQPFPSLKYQVFDTACSSISLSIFTARLLDPILPLITALRACFGWKKGLVVAWKYPLFHRSLSLLPFFASSQKRLPGSGSILSCLVSPLSLPPGKAREQQPEFQSEATAQRRRFPGKKKTD